MTMNIVKQLVNTFCDLLLLLAAGGLILPPFVYGKNVSPAAEEVGGSLEGPAKAQP